MSIDSKNVDYVGINAALESLRKIPANEFRLNEHKPKRELWCAAKMLEHLGLTNYLLRSNPTESDSTDVSLVSLEKDSKEYRLQIVDIAPKHLKSNALFDKFLGHGYSDLKAEMLQLLIDTVHDKEVKYSNKDKAELNLLIYFNPPTKKHDTSESLGWTIMLDSELDLDFPAIKSSLAFSKFGSIILLISDETFFIKNDRLI